METFDSIARDVQDAVFTLSRKVGKSEKCQASISCSISVLSYNNCTIINEQL